MLISATFVVLKSSVEEYTLKKASLFRFDVYPLLTLTITYYYQIFLMIAISQSKEWYEHEQTCDAFEFRSALKIEDAIWIFFLATLLSL